jgi:2-polyprenyl-3-methyl-5-hydroxy-6-metoxy-1,4-benzoquinol methylase
MEPFCVDMARIATRLAGGVIGRTPSRCRVCDGAVAFAFTATERMLGVGDAFDYFECELCGCLQIGRVPDDLGRYYTDEYYTGKQRRSPRRKPGLVRFIRVWTRLRLADNWIARWISGRRYARFDWFRRTQTGLRDTILDVGCGSGRLIFQLDSLGFERLTGIDPRLDDALLENATPRFERIDAEAHRGAYRLVMAHHSYEHMADPASGFAALARLVEPGGHLLLRVPLADSWARRVYCAEWVQLDAPRHFHLHTRRSIDLLARRFGLRIVHIADDSGPFQIWGSELYRQGERLVTAGRGGQLAFGWRERLAMRKRARELTRQGLGDQACFYLQRLE